MVIYGPCFQKCMRIQRAEAGRKELKDIFNDMRLAEDRAAISVSLSPLSSISLKVLVSPTVKKFLEVLSWPPYHSKQP